jgi:hypothetical protein
VRVTMPSMRAPARTVQRARRLRQEMTLPELVLWTWLRREPLSRFHFRRQHPIGSYVLDFYCAKARLCIRSMATRTMPPPRPCGTRRGTGGFVSRTSQSCGSRLRTYSRTSRWKAC